ncbi:MULTISPECIES: lysozyme family protein [unclassified Virgibacillus]|uniref:lysozyme family protein n=1 Tax=unclassified Virgibacillus TaxID=2620237 RepID=UPI0024DE42FB|nr:lysozyme family protein [Virgibacillus sp. LDC-1]
MRKKTKTAIKKAFLVAAFLCVVLFALSVTMHNDIEPQSQYDSTAFVSEAVYGYQPVVKKYAEQYGVSNYVDVLLAMMMQESGGRGQDPMQSSESYCGKRGCIKDPEKSIKQGVYYFSETLQAADGDVELAIQSYNFGKGFVSFVKKQGSSYSQNLAIEFSRKMYEQASDPTIYSCLRKEAKQYNACYGDIYYVRDVLQYRNAIALN